MFYKSSSILVLLATASVCYAGLSNDIETHFQSSGARPTSAKTGDAIIFPEMTNLFSSLLSPFLEYASEAVSTYEKYITTAILRIELFLMASGEHALSSANKLKPDDDNRYHIIAMSVTQMMKKLPIMDSVNSLINNVTTEVGDLFTRNNQTQPVHETMFEILETKMSSSPKLASVFNDLRKKMETQHLAPRGENNFHLNKLQYSNIFKTIQKLSRDPELKIVKLNTAFLHKSKAPLKSFNSWDEGSKYEYRLANALLQLARENSFNNQVQTLYNNAVRSVINDTNPWFKPTEAVDRLFETLQQYIDREPVLKINLNRLMNAITLPTSNIGENDLNKGMYKSFLDDMDSTFADLIGY